MLPARVVQATKASVIPDYRMNQLGKEENPYVTLDCDYTWNYLYTFQLFYAFIVICSLIENTGYKILSVVFGICHAISPVLFVFFGYQCLLRKIAQYGALKAGIGIVVCLVIYFWLFQYGIELYWDILPKHGR